MRVFDKQISQNEPLVAERRSYDKAVDGCRGRLNPDSLYGTLQFGQ
jgi:hypothetical protein